MFLSPGQDALYYWLSDDIGEVEFKKALSLGRIDTARREKVREVDTPNDVHCMCLDPDMKAVYLVRATCVEVRDPVTLEARKAIPFSDYVGDAAARRDGMLFISLGHQWGEVVVLDVNSNRVVGKWGTGQSSANYICISPDAKRLYSSGANDTGPSSSEATCLRRPCPSARSRTRRAVRYS
jgi:hypothetical protein